MENFDDKINLEKIKNCHDRIKDSLKITPVETSSYIDSLADRNLFFKCEHLQKTGSFKTRGALNAVLIKMNSKDSKEYNGCVTHSSGNHGQALAWACHVNKIPCTIVLPKNTPKINQMILVQIPPIVP